MWIIVETILSNFEYVDRFLKWIYLPSFSLRKWNGMTLTLWRGTGKEAAQTSVSFRKLCGRRELWKGSRKSYKTPPKIEVVFFSSSAWGVGYTLRKPLVARWRRQRSSGGSHRWTSNSPPVKTLPRRTQNRQRATSSKR